MITKRETIIFVIISISLMLAVISVNHNNKITGYAPYSEKTADAIKRNLELEPIATYIQEASQRFNVDINLIRAIIAQESSGSHLNPDGTVKHSKCCWGIMQVGKSAFDQVKAQGGLTNFDQISCPTELCIKNNILVGTAYLKWLSQSMCNQDMDCVIASYNGGPGCYRQGSSCSNYNFAVNTYLPSVKNYYTYFGGATFTPIPQGNLKYYLKPSFKLELDYDFGIYETLKAQADIALHDVRLCFMEGKSPSECAKVQSLIRDITEEIKDAKKEYTIKFSEKRTYANKPIEYKFAYIIEDNFAPPVSVNLQGGYDKINNKILLTWKPPSYDYARSKVYCYDETKRILATYYPSKNDDGSLDLDLSVTCNNKIALGKTFTFILYPIDNVANENSDGTEIKIKIE